MEKDSVDDLITNLKDSVKDMILAQRQKESNKIRLIRRLKDKQRNREDQQMMEIRTSIAKTLDKEFKKGDGKACKPNPDAKEQRRICDKYYMDSGVYYDKCMNPQNYCTFCCVGEYGNEYEKEKL